MGMDAGQKAEMKNRECAGSREFDVGMDVGQKVAEIKIASARRKPASRVRHCSASHQGRIARALATGTYLLHGVLLDFFVTVDPSRKDADAERPPRLLTGRRGLVRVELLAEGPGQRADRNHEGDEPHRRPDAHPRPEAAE